MMEEFFSQGYGVYSQYKDHIVVGLLALGCVWKFCGNRVSAVASVVAKAVNAAFWNIVWPPSKPLPPETQRIVDNVENALLLPGTKILCYGQVEYHPGGVVKLSPALMAFGAMVRTCQSAEVKLTRTEKRAVKAEYDKWLPLRVEEADARNLAAASNPSLRIDGTTSSNAQHQWSNLDPNSGKKT